jgi:lipopolysaccharide export system permease protein
MKAAGVSAHQIIAPLIIASMAIAVVAFLFQERVVTRANAALDVWEAVDYGRVPPDKGVITGVWVKHGDDLIRSSLVAGNGANVRLTDVAIYDRSGGTLTAIIRAPRGARYRDGWRLIDARRFDVNQGTLTQVPELVVARGVTPDQFTLGRVDPDQQDVATLRRSIGEMEAGGRPTTALEASLWHKFSGPLSTVLMPLLAAVAAFGLARSGQLFVRAVLGMALGFAYFVVDNFALAMGNFGAYPPLLAAWAPFALFLLIGETVLIRTEE